MAAPAVSNLNFRSLRQMSWTDREYDEVQTYLKDGTLPPERKTAQQRSDFKKKANQFELNKDGEIVLMVNAPPEWQVDKKTGKYLFPDVKFRPFAMLVVKESDVEKIIVKLWNDPRVNGGRGVVTFHERLQQEVLGISRREVSKVLQTIETHQISMASNSKKVVAPIITTHKMEHWEMDLIDMQSTSHFNKGVNYILHVKDIFSKFLWAAPIKNKSVETVAYALQQIILREGAPEKLSSDNGGEFIGEAMVELCLQEGIEQRHSEAYSPQSQGAVERVNKTIKEALNRYVDGYNSKRYIDALQHIIRTYNRAKHGTTKLSPFEVHKGISQGNNVVNTLVADNIKSNAAKMVANSEKALVIHMRVLEIGDTVRLDTIALKSVRKMVTFLKKARGITTWTKETYTITEEKEDEHGLMLYRIDPTPEGEKVSRWYSRKYFQWIDADKLVKRKRVTDKRDLNFGQGGFDNERHLAEMPRGIARVARLSEDKMEEEEQKSAAGAAAARPRRAGAGAGVFDPNFPMLAEGAVYWR